MSSATKLREVRPSDLDHFFKHQQDQDANHMAAFTAKNPHDRGVFDLHWDTLLKDESIRVRTIEAQGEVAGHILSYVQDDTPELSYWIGKEFWGKGITTEAVTAFLGEFTERPIRARAVADNDASIKILLGAGFQELGEENSFATARGEVVREVILQLS